MGINGILFDLGRVLVDFDMSECERTLSARSRVSHDELMRLLWDTGWARRYERGEVSAREFYTFVESEAGLAMDYDAFMKCWTEVFDPIPILPPHMLPALAALYPMTLVSNTNEAHVEYVRANYDVLPFFEHHIFSYQVGALKPDRKIFECAIEATGLRPEDLLFVDDRDENVVAATGLGLHAHRFRSVEGLVELFSGLGVDLANPDHRASNDHGSRVR